MEKTIMLNSVFVFIVIWGITLVFLWFRPKMEILWKFAATIIFCFYIWFFWDEILKGKADLKADWFKVVITFLKEIVFVLYYLLFIIWPIYLVIIFYKADDFGAERMLKFISILTVIIWIIITSYVYKQKDIDDFLYQKLKTVVPFTQ